MIRVCAGTYAETVIVSETTLTIVGADGYASTFVEGFLSPAIKVVDATLSLEELTIGGNTTAYNAASGIQAERAALSVERCRISENATKAEQAFAIWAEDTTSTWESVHFEDNTVFGLANFVDSDTTIRHAVFRFNTYSPWTPSEGWLISHLGGTFELSNALLYENLSVEAETPIRVDSGAVRHAVFYHNRNLASDVFARAQPGVVWENNIFFDNDACGLTIDPGAEVQYNASDSNSYQTYTNVVNWCLSDGAELDESNITEYPVFIGYSHWDFQLKKKSPCVDAGNPDASLNDPDGSRSDMGAFGGPLGEWNGTTPRG